MYVCTFEDLVHEVAEMGFGEGLFGLDDPVEVRVEEFHDDVELVVAFAQEEVFEGDDVFVLPQTAHHADFAEDMLGVDDVGGDGGDAFDRHVFVRFGVEGGADDAVGTFPYWFEVLVDGVDFEGGAADGVGGFVDGRDGAVVELLLVLLGVR